MVARRRDDDCGVWAVSELRMRHGRHFGVFQEKAMEAAVHWDHHEHRACDKFEVVPRDFLITEVHHATH
jgi:hypothetical protein